MEHLQRGGRATAGRPLTAGPPGPGGHLVVSPGVFDPSTLAQLALTEAARQPVDRLLVVVAVDPRKPPPLFSAAERVGLLRESLPAALRARVEVQAHAGVLAPFARCLGACALVGGMCSGPDPDVELAHARRNARSGRRAAGRPGPGLAPGAWRGSMLWPQPERLPWGGTGRGGAHAGVDGPGRRPGRWARAGHVLCGPTR